MHNHACWYAKLHSHSHVHNKTSGMTRWVRDVLHRRFLEFVVCRWFLEFAIFQWHIHSHAHTHMIWPQTWLINFAMSRRLIEFVTFIDGSWYVDDIYIHMPTRTEYDLGHAVCCSVLGSCCSVLQWPCCVGCLNYIHTHTHTQRPQAWQHRSSRPWKLCWALRSACIGTLLQTRWCTCTNKKTCT